MYSSVRAHYGLNAWATTGRVPCRTYRVAPCVDFDFSVVDDSDFREDSVREVFLVPLLGSLGFTEK
jgi:hypothetical protein